MEVTMRDASTGQAKIEALDRQGSYDLPQGSQSKNSLEDVTMSKQNITLNIQDSADWEEVEKPSSDPTFNTTPASKFGKSPSSLQDPFYGLQRFRSLKEWWHFRSLPDDQDNREALRKKEIGDAAKDHLMDLRLGLFIVFSVLIFGLYLTIFDSAGANMLHISEGPNGTCLATSQCSARQTAQVPLWKTETLTTTSTEAGATVTITRYDVYAATSDSFESTCDKEIVTATETVSIYHTITTGPTTVVSQVFPTLTTT